MIQLIRKSKIAKIIAIITVLNLFVDLIHPKVVLALTGGPSQPEVQSFEPVGTSEMVDLFSGDFVYNIPLMDVGGYPINISYHSGITMDQEASWVGLGWNINPGAITRNMRGIPDDFKGEIVKKELNVKPNKTWGGNAGLGGEILGIDGLGVRFGMGISYNNYTGLATEESFSLSYSKGGTGKFTGSLGLNSNSSGGLSISPELSYSAKISDEEYPELSGSLSIGTSFNSRQGFKNLTIGVGLKKKNLENHSISRNGGSSIDFGVSTYVPMVEMPMVNSSINCSFKAGITIFSFDVTLDFAGYYSQQVLEKNKEEVPAFGYLYSECGINSDMAMLDFNREKDGSYTVNTPALPITNFTYDVLSVSGQGIGGMYRPFRNDLGHVYDRKVQSISRSANLGAEIKIVKDVQGGVEVTINDVNTLSGRWSNSISKEMMFSTNSDNSDYERFHFKQAGEKTVDPEPDLFSYLGGFSPVGFNLIDQGGFKVGISASSNLQKGLNKSKRSKRQRRNQVISFLTRKEYTSFAFDKQLENSISSYAKPHHIAEITTLRPDGSRYIFGLPVYNTFQKEATFNISRLDGENEIDVNKGLVTYDSDTRNPDNSIKNIRGTNHFYSATELPAYAHSYLLTAVLSSDYVDITGDGASDDDLGSYTKFSYEKIEDMYNWRVPFKKNIANYNEGLKTRNKDDKASYVYGEKVLFYLNSVETKNYIAIFETAPRADGYCTVDENGGLGNISMMFLKKISLFAKPEYQLRSSSYDPVPIKVVHFVYDYSLCEGIDNNDKRPRENNHEVSNDGGKLTLKKLFFTYGKSNKGRFSPYEFTYQDFNPEYDIKGYDRWGNYKQNPSHGMPTSEFPYVEQDKTVADRYSSAWSLTKIGLPSGGTISVEYESDDYAFVQNKRAMQMFRITGIGKDPTSDNPENSNGTKLNEIGLSDERYLYFKLHEPNSFNKIDPKTYMDEHYIPDDMYVYFRALMKINGCNDGKEYVSGYAEIKDYGIVQSKVSGKYTHGFIRFEKIENKNPISQAALQFARIYTADLIYGYGGIGENMDVLTIIKKLAIPSSFGNIVEAIMGQDNYLYEIENFGKEIELNKSWVRLLNPNGKKLGGGVRVKRLSICDEWDQMVSDNSYESFDYGQEYHYVTEDGISSGVASYEPMIGADENPFRQPVFHGNDKKVLLAPNERYYMEKPFGESFFPAPNVGYSEVTVKSLRHLNTNPNATGHMVHEFYTSKDYPTRVDKTKLENIEKKSNFIAKFLKLDVKHYMTASQGFVVILNDMHGKVKAKWVYAGGQSTPISGIEYFYRDNGVTINGKKVRGNHLDNRTPVINRDGKVFNALVGVDYDFIADFRQQTTRATNIGLQVNLYAMSLGPIFLILPPIWPTINLQNTRFRSAVATKVINQYGILEKTIAYDIGSMVSTTNLAFDAETGEVLLTKTINEFEDEIYSFSYPAHWAYDWMGPAYKNIGFICKGINKKGVQFNNDGWGKVGNSVKNFVKGDELAVYLTSTIKSNSKKGWVIEVNEETKKIKVVDIEGNPITHTAKLKIIRSGRRNMQSTNIGSFTSFRNPIDYNGDNIVDKNLKNLDQSYKIINAGAVEFSDDWNRFCNCNPVHSSGIVSSNPYITGEKGNWRPKRSYLFLTGRQQSLKNNNTNIRQDGIFTNFNPFWRLPKEENGFWEADSRNWTWTSEITIFSPYGFELENKDALGRYSSAIYKYNNTLPIAVSSNARYKDFGFDGFEDIGFDDCEQDELTFGIITVEEAKAEITDKESHSGKYSLKVNPGKSVELKRNIIRFTK